MATSVNRGARSGLFRAAGDRTGKAGTASTWRLMLEDVARVWGARSESRSGPVAARDLAARALGLLVRGIVDALTPPRPEAPLCHSGSERTGDVADHDVLGEPWLGPRPETPRGAAKRAVDTTAGPCSQKAETATRGRVRRRDRA